jgi:mono/diheme cytochrome c family protein
VTKLMFCLATILALSAADSDARAQAVGDPKEGLALAQQTCSQCHATVVEQDRSPNPRAPRFVDLAATSGMTSTALLVALTTPHAGMPMFTLTSEQRDDIIAYILSLH